MSTRALTSILMLYGLKKGGPAARWWVFALASWIVLWNVGGVYVGTLEDGLTMAEPAAVFMLANGAVAVLVALSMLVPSSGAWFRQNDAFA
jgi:hypothetical protein